MSKKIEWKGVLRKLPKYCIAQYDLEAKLPDWIEEMGAEVIVSTERPATIYAGFECMEDWDQDLLHAWVKEQGFMASGFTLVEQGLGTIVVLLGFLEEPTNTDDSKLSSRCLEVAKWYERFIWLEEQAV